MTNINKIEYSLNTTSYTNNKTKNLWFLTEERPKKEVLETIFKYFAKDYKIGFFYKDLTIIPILNKDKYFDFTYDVIGFNCSIVDKVFIKTVSGYTSFADYLIFYQENLPKQNDTPIYIIEETKTDDKESRNTGVYQRSSKFVIANQYYPTTKKIMLYNLKVKQKEESTLTYIFGTRLLITFGVKILGKRLDNNVFKPFSSIDEIIEYKNNIPLPNKTNTPIRLTKYDDKIEISGRLYKSNGLNHDPNIGALSIIVAVLRKLGWNKDIIITQHGLQQKHIGTKNKFIRIANFLNIKLKGLNIPKTTLPNNYWHYETEGEKLGTIFIHIVTENFTESYSIFENHAGCEKSYFMTSRQEYIPLVKYENREEYKAGNKNKIVSIPDLVLIDINERESITIEGKKFVNKNQGIEELNNYDSFDNMYLKKYYPTFKIIKTVVLYGSNEESVIEVEVGFLLNAQGKLILGINAPKLFKRAINNLLDYWK
ncbi:MAG: hypothetical protein IJ180_05310 [Bacteroidales bacterium]|nr:hypothetical protein [Bacteroidales bacterium]